MSASYIDKIPLSSGIVKQKLNELSRMSVMFDVPNPESDVDAGGQEATRAFSAFRQKRDQRHPMPRPQVAHIND